MYKTVRINERVKPFVINGRRVLYKSKKKPQILDLSQEEYDALKSIERSGKYQDLDSRCERLLKNKILRLEESEEEENSGTRYEKTSVFLAEKYTSSANGVLRGLQSKKVIILGLGGLGCMLLMHMVSLGIKDYVLIDYDKVHLSNLNRQFLFNNKGVGQSKTELAKKYIIENIPSAKVITICKRIDDNSKLLNLLKGIKADIFVNAADTPLIKIQKESVNYASQTNTPYISGGVAINDLYWGPLLNRKESYDAYLEYLTQIEKPIEFGFNVSGSVGFTNSLLVDFIMSDVFYYLIGQYNDVKSIDKRMKFDLIKYKMTQSRRL